MSNVSVINKQPPQIKIDKSITEIYFFENDENDKQINIPPNSTVWNKLNVKRDYLKYLYNNNNVCDKKGDLNINYGLDFLENGNGLLLVLKLKKAKDLPSTSKMDYVRSYTSRRHNTSRLGRTESSGRMGITLGIMVITNDKQNDKQLNVEFLCASKEEKIFKNIGTVFFEYVFELAQFNKKDIVFLEAINSAEGFYKRLGFTKIKENDDGLIEMKYKLNNGINDVSPKEQSIPIQNPPKTIQSISKNKNPPPKPLSIVSNTNQPSIQSHGNFFNEGYKKIFKKATRLIGKITRRKRYPVILSSRLGGKTRKNTRNIKPVI